MNINKVPLHICSRGHDPLLTLDAGKFVTAEGQLVMEEEELTLVLRLQELKVQYRRQHEELGSTRAEVNYCQHLVDQCRIRLLMGKLRSSAREARKQALGSHSVIPYPHL